MEQSQTVIIWWISLCCIAIFNIGLLVYAYRLFQKKRASMIPDMIRYRSWQFYLAIVYVLGCGFRSVLPRGDIRRIVIVDSWISAVAIGRTVATIAELCFILQLSLMVYEGGKFTDNKTVQKLAKIPFPLIVIAEIFSWYACTTTNYIGSVIEESLWAVSASIIMMCCILLRKNYIKEQLKFVHAALLGLLAYVIYMVTVDVPAYIRGWTADQAAGKTYSTVLEGFKEVATHWTVSRSHSDWQYEFVWMTLYFSLAVWVSIYLINAPHLNKNLKKKP